MTDRETAIRAKLARLKTIANKDGVIPREAVEVFDTIAALIGDALCDLAAIRALLEAQNRSMDEVGR